MIQGTGSGVGKSMLTTALCRLFARAGHRVAPFKAQNMSLNACEVEGGEIGRAQAAQAEAAGVAPCVDMNPVLLKPETDRSSQVIVRGTVWGRAEAHDYARMRDALWPVVVASLDRLRRDHDLVLIEGAGSPAEINLRELDIVNMPVAHLAEAPVLLVGDIDRGGMFAALVVTLELLSPADRLRIAGFVVNKFRGDRSLLSPGLAALSARTGLPVLGVVPHFDERLVPPEDSLAEADGAVSVDLPVVGTYLHGVLADARVRRHLLARLAARKGVAVDPRWGSGGGADRYDRLADIVGGALDMTAVARLVGVADAPIG